MCGIVGYTGTQQAAPILLNGLRTLEYRGYDSAGIAVQTGEKICVRKAHGRLDVLSGLTHDGADVPGTAGIGHTRWATHGEPSDVNSHPHLSNSGKVAVVHNGIVENYLPLRDFLSNHGYTFLSVTDTEVVSQLLDYCYHGDPLKAVLEAVSMLEGSYALGILFSDFPDRIYAAKKDSPLIVGLCEGQNLLASDIPALLPHTREVVRLKEREIAVLTPEEVRIYDRRGESVPLTVQHVDWSVDAAEKAGYPHFMIKEIMEQGKALADTLRPRLKGGRVQLELKNITPEYLGNVRQIHIVACGSAYHVGRVGEILFQDALHIPVNAYLASEYQYSSPLADERTLCIVISQSGETIDTLFALRKAKELGAKTVSIVNVVGSAIAIESDDVLYTMAGPEIAVATTKAYSTQLAVLYLLLMYMCEVRHQADEALTEAHIAALKRLPEQIDKLIAENKEQIQYLASLYFNLHDIFFIGRHLDYALALEGSLKLKEISYIHSEAYAAGELKHGTMSLIEPGTLVIALCTHAPLLPKMISNIQEVRARGAVVIALAREGAPHVADEADHMIWLPNDDSFTLSSLSVVPLQLFAYYIALFKGCDIDKPRNLAKSVTVE